MGFFTEKPDRSGIPLVCYIEGDDREKGVQRNEKALLRGAAGVAR